MAVLPGSDKVFCDTSALIALFLRSDANHVRAKRVWRTLLRRQRPLITSEYIFDELMTLLAGRVAHRFACEVGGAILRSESLTLLYIQDEQVVAIFEEFKRYRDQEFSFTDVASFYLMRQEGIGTAFTFDSDFVKAGFVALP